MDASRDSVDVFDQLERLLLACDICLQAASDPVGTTCGHVFCWSCLNETFQGEHARPCPVCRADIREETAQCFPIRAHDGSSVGSGTSTTAVEPTMRPLNAQATARMEVVQEFLDDAKERTLALQLDLSRQLSELREERVRELEQVVDNLVHMNLTLRQVLEARDLARNSQNGLENALSEHYQT